MAVDENEWQRRNDGSGGIGGNNLVGGFVGDRGAQGGGCAAGGGAIGYRKVAQGGGTEDGIRGPMTVVVPMVQAVSEHWIGRGGGESCIRSNGAKQESKAFSPFLNCLRLVFYYLSRHRNFTGPHFCRVRKRTTVDTSPSYHSYIAHLKNNPPKYV